MYRMVEKALHLPWWCWPFFALGIGAGIAIGMIEASVSSGVSPADQVRRFRFNASYAAYMVRRIVHRA